MIFWLGFLASEKLYIKRSILVAPTCFINDSISNKFKSGFSQIEVEEIYIAKVVAFFYIRHYLVSKKRLNGKEG